MTSLDPKWERSQRHEREVYSERENIPGPQRAKDIFGKFGKSVSELQGKRILSVGAGLGVIHSLHFDCENVAIDPLTHHNSDKLSGSSADLITGVGENLPFESNSMDVVFSYNVLDHCIRPEKVVDEAYRVTKDGGELLLETNTYEVPEFVRSSVVGRLDTEHPHHFSSREVKDIVERSGFEDVEVERESRFELLRKPNARRIGGMLFRMRRCFITAERQ